MSELVIPQLIDAAAQLTAQEAVLKNALTEIQEQRQGLRTVIAMFDSSGDAAKGMDLVSETVPEVGGKSTPTAANAKMKSTSSNRRSQTTKPKKMAETTNRSRRDGRSADWQRYIQSEYKGSPLPEIVGNILNAEPKVVFKIAQVMSEIFQDDMPEAHFLKVRNRVSNILSAGARNGDWFRGRAGTYSLSKNAVKS